MNPIVQINLLRNSILSLIKNKNHELVRLLQKYNYEVTGDSSSELEQKTTTAIINSEPFTAELISLLHRSKTSSLSGWSNESQNNTNWIDAALSGLGQLTSTWQQTAQMKADADKYAADKKLSPLQIIGIIVAGITVLSIGAVIVIKVSRK